MNRRNLMFGAVAAAGVVPADVAAGASLDQWTDERVQELLARIRAGMTAAAERVRQGLALHPCPDEALAGAVIDAAPALHGYGALHDLPLEAQVHPDGQALVVDVVERLADAAARVRAAMGALSEDELGAMDGVLRSTPRRLERVLARLARMSGEVDGGPVTVRFEAARDDLRHRLSERGLRRAVREQGEDYDRVLELVARQGAGALPRPHAATVARVERARAHWGARADGGGSAASPGLTGGQIAGIVFGGVIIVGGLLVVAAGISLMSCPCVGIPVLLLGVALVVAGAAIISFNSHPHLPPTEPEE